MNQQPNPGGYPGQAQTGQPGYLSHQQQLPQQGYSVPQTPTSAQGPYGQPITPGRPHPPQQQQQLPQASPQHYHQAQSQLANAYQPMPGSMPPPQPGRPGGQANGAGGAVGGPPVQATVPPEVLSIVKDGKKYRLEVVQQPIRARMCGFGDKDRRPITPPPCIRLIITDEKTGQECDPNEFDTNFFILTVDLWDETGTKEVNLVRHSATSPSISAATSSSYPPPTAPVYPFSANTAAAVNAHSQAAAAATGMQVHVGLAGPAYGPPGYSTHHAAPYMAQPPQTPPPGHGATHMTAYSAAPDPSQQGVSRPQDAQSYYVSPNGQPTGPSVNNPYAQYGMPQYAPPIGQQLLSPAHAAPMDPRSAPSGMFTRNLIGSLAVNANPLTDTHGKLGIWFILQDLSVRTEGSFRLKMQFCSVADPNQKNTLIRGSAPILASTFSDPFTVFSAKKFPGVIESTPLSKCFAMQGVKIPIRKDGPSGKAAEVDDDQQE